MPAEQPAFDPVPFQRKVRCGSKCLVYTSYAIVICAIFQIVCNTIFIFFIDNFTDVAWVDVDGQPMELELDGFGLFVMASLKVIAAVILLKQAKLAIKLFNPILKEYRQAERGITRGIRMTTRKSKSMHMFRRRVCKISCILVALVAGAFIYATGWLGDVADKYVDAKFDYIISMNNTYGYPYSVENVKSNITASELPRGAFPREEEDDEDEP